MITLVRALCKAVNLARLNFQRCRCSNHLRQDVKPTSYIFYRSNLLHFPLYALLVVIIIRGTLRTISSACQTSETQYYVKSQTIRFLDANLAHSAKSKSNLLFPPRYSSNCTKRLNSSQRSKRLANGSEKQRTEV